GTDGGVARRSRPAGRRPVSLAGPADRTARRPDSAPAHRGGHRMTRTASTWTAEDMLELGTRHARLEAEGELDLVMETLVADPVYEFWPIGRRLRGRDGVRRYYEHLMGTFFGEQEGYELIEEWISDRSLAQEYAMTVRFEAGPETHRVI